MLTIAIDFDETLTADAELWRDFIDSCKRLGHQVICVTARRHTDDNCETLRGWMNSHGIDLTIYFTAIGSKAGYMKSRGINVDIWIDADTGNCALGH